MAGFTKNDSLAAEAYWAHQLHVPEDLAHAVAEVESHHDPYAIGDHGTSFGDYQLHQGGMLGSLTREQAFNPFVNARVAINSLASTMQREPGASPGQIAADSQRPADRAGYARKVTAAMQAGPAGHSSAGVQNVVLSQSQLASFPGIPNPLGGASWLWDHSGGWVLHGVGNAAGDVGGAIAAPFVAIFNLFKTVWDFFTSAHTWIRIGLFVGGGILVVVGLKAIVAPDAPMPVPVPV